ncbi:MAG: hypothetical protein HUJ51_04310 [Eggerthellaceae bacterium]|nr:hypothetical protein [Eggerthellaceae bacterium]
MRKAQKCAEDEGLNVLYAAKKSKKRLRQIERALERRNVLLAEIEKLQAEPDFTRARLKPGGHLGRQHD